jgi:hypothetical protein
MPNVVLMKNNIVTTIVFSVDADVAALSDTAKIGDVYDPVAQTFTTPVPPPAPPSQPLNELGE